ncbi:MAG: septum site-determining protein Ssd [Sporichthyaceae bacterium]
MTIPDITARGRTTRRDPARPLLLTADPEVLDDVLALAQEAGTEVDVLADVSAARSRWSAAPLVLVAADRTVEVLRRRLPRRAGVLLIGRDLDDASIWERAIGLGAEQVVFLPEAEDFVRDRLGRCAPTGASGPAPTVCVVGGRGGAGASTLAVALAATASRRGTRTLLIDGDPLGGGLDLVLGQECTEGARWSDLHGIHPGAEDAWWGATLPRVGGLELLSWDRGDVLAVPGAAMAAALAGGRAGNDLVVVDLPRQLDVAAEVALGAGGPVLLVVPAELRATVAAARVVRSISAPGRDLRVVVRGPAPSGLTAGRIASSLGLPLAGQLAPEPGIADDLEDGHTPGARAGSPLSAFCARFLDELCLQRAA